MDTSTKINTEVALLCARLYLRDGKNYLQQGFFKSGIVALYDAIVFGMHYYIAEPACRGNLSFTNEEIWDHAVLYHKLAKVGVFDDIHAFNHLSQLVERALWQGVLSFDTHCIIEDIEVMLSKLGVIPFDELMLKDESVAVC